MLENLKPLLDLCEKGNNLGEKISLVGATKTVDVDTINLAVEGGLEIVAENRVQEFREKHDKIIGAKQHFIGHLQTNKVKYLVGEVEIIQSVDSVHLAQEISKVATRKNVEQKIFIELNAGGELSKSGFSFDNVYSQTLEIAKLDGVKVVGLMAMLPKSDDREFLADLCKKVRAEFDKLKNAGLPLVHLSVGMSADYLIAIENGSNMIRLGSAIFGKRNYEVK